MELTRRKLISHAGFGALGLSFFSSPVFAKSAQQLAPSGHPDWPTPPKPVDAGATPAEKLPLLKAPLEQIGGGDYRPLPEHQKIGVAVVGLGELATHEILPAFGQSMMCKVTALVSGDRVKAKRIANEYGVPESGLYSYQDFDRIKDNKDVQVVYIVLPNSMHKEYTIRAAKAGKHVLCEKPMAMSSQEAQEMIDACKQAKVKLMIAYRQQYEPNNRWMRELVRQKTFGAIKIFEASNYQNESGKSGGKQQWRHIKAMAGGGALPDIGLYCLSAARFLSGEEPTEVTALEYSTPKDPRFTEIEESIAFMMRFPSGMIAMCAASYGCHETKRYRFTAENGWFGMEPSFAYHGLKSEVSYALGSPFEHKENPTLMERNQFALEMDHMADCVLHNKQPHTGGEEGLQDHKIMEAIYESARTRRPVQLPHVTGLDTTRNDSI